MNNRRDQIIPPCLSVSPCMGSYIFRRNTGVQWGWGMRHAQPRKGKELNLRKDTI